MFSKNKESNLKIINLRRSNLKLILSKITRTVSVWKTLISINAIIFFFFFYCGMLNYIKYFCVIMIVVERQCSIERRAHEVVIIDGMEPLREVNEKDPLE